MNVSNYLDHIIDWKPATPNLFKVEIEPGIQGYNTAFHCTKYSFPDHGLTFTRDKGTKMLALDNYEYADTISITWDESSKYAVWKMHSEWTDEFIDKDSGLYKSATGADEIARRYKTFIISHFDTDLKKVLTIKVSGVLPPKLPGLFGDWGSSDPTSLSFTYPITKVKPTWEDLK
jgi:hypothetical protein